MSAGDISIGELHAADAQVETEARDITISEMKRMVDSLEVELQNSISRESSLRKVLLFSYLILPVYGWI